MNSGRHKPVPGLHFIATPIGAARDITLRALDLLAEADAIAAEDTRTLRHLMEIHGVALRDRPLISYHDHNGTQARPKIIGWLSEGKSVVYASEAGTPLVADPGYQLGRSAIEEGYPVYSAPGPLSGPGSTDRIRSAVRPVSFRRFSADQPEGTARLAERAGRRSGDGDPLRISQPPPRSVKRPSANVRAAASGGHLP